MDNEPLTVISVATIRERGTLERNRLAFLACVALLLGLSASPAKAAPIFPEHERASYKTPELAVAPARGGAVLGAESQMLNGPSGPASSLTSLALDGAARVVANPGNLRSFDPAERPSFGISLAFRSSLPADSAGDELGGAGGDIPLFNTSSTLLPLPEPTSVFLLTTGLVGLWARRKLRRKGSSTGPKRGEPARE